MFIIVWTCSKCNKNRVDQNETLNARFTVAAAAVRANTNNSQVTFNRGESVISYDAALRNSTLVVQPISQADNDFNECKLPTYEEFTSKQTENL